MLAHSSLILNFIAEGHLCAGNKSAQNLIVGEFLLSSIVLLVISQPLFTRLAWFGPESYSGQRERKSVLQSFQSKICELVSGKLSKCLCIQSGIPLNLRTVVTSWSYCSRGKWRIDHLNDHSHRFSQTYFLKTFHVAYTIFSSRQRIGSHTGSVL